MCGIAGVIQTSSSKDGGKKIDLMLELMENRGPDSMGIYKPDAKGCIDAKGIIWLSVLRISIIYYLFPQTQGVAMKPSHERKGFHFN